VFLGTVRNNHFYGGFKKNIFAKGCEYNKFEWNMYNNVFTEKVNYTQGSIQNAYVASTSYDSFITKEFKMLHSLDNSEPVFVVTYLDGDTLTTQVLKLN
jgi:type VI protein secretion system component Hcp